MVPSFIVLPESRVVQIVYHDTPNFEEWVQMMSSISLDPNYQPGFSYLVDRRAAGVPSDTFARRVADYLRRHGNEIGERIHYATVVDADAVDATRAMIEQFPDPSLMRVFTDPIEARKWASRRASAEGACV